MDLTEQKAIVGLRAVGASTRQGVSWKAAHGTAPSGDVVSLSSATAALVLVCTSGATSGRLSIVMEELAANCDVLVDSAIETISVADITGTGAGSLNVTYTRTANVNGWPSWTNATAVIRRASNFWEIVLGGVVQFRAYSPVTVLPTLVPAWEAVGAATGTPDVGAASSGEEPVLNRAGWVDFENRALGDPQGVRGLRVTCTAGGCGAGWAAGMLELAAGDSFLFVRPAGDTPGWLGETLNVVALEVDSAWEVDLVLEEAE